ncbi:MAG: hypothetical protein HYY09_01640 [Firmicutes bacterium]|nr:hypothetical protein [Bacillota bacterium]
MEELERWLAGLDKGTRAFRVTWERLVLRRSAPFGRTVAAGDDQATKDAIRFLSRLERSLGANMTSLYFRRLAIWFTPGDPHRGSVKGALSLVRGLGGCTRQLRDLAASELRAKVGGREIPLAFRDRERRVLESWYRHLDGVRREALLVGERVESQGKELDQILPGRAATTSTIRSLAVGLSLYVILSSIGRLAGRPEELPAASALVKGWWDRRTLLTRETLASAGPDGIFHPSNRYYLLNPGFGLREWKGGKEEQA